MASRGSVFGTAVCLGWSLPMHTRIGWILAFVLALGLAGCATLPEQLPRGVALRAPR